MDQGGWITLCTLKEERTAKGTVYVEDVKPELIEMELAEVEALCHKVLADNPPDENEAVEKYLMRVELAAYATFPKQVIRRVFKPEAKEHVKPIISSYFTDYWRAVKEGAHVLECTKKKQREEIEQILGEFPDRASLRAVIVNFADEAGETALFAAAPDGQVDILKLLHANGADLEHRNVQGMCAVHYSAKAGTLASLQLLNELGADMSAIVVVPPTATDQAAWGFDKKNALQIAEETNRTACVEFLKPIVVSEDEKVEEVQANMQEKAAEEETKELAEVAAADNVNEESKAALEEQLADKMAAQTMANKAEAEEKEELAEVETADLVNEESKAALEEQLADKMAAQTMANKAEAEEKEELAEVEAADLVNEDSKAALEEKLAEAQQKMEAAEAEAKAEAQA